MNAAFSLRSGFAQICAAVLLCSAMAVSAESISGISAKRSATVDLGEAERSLRQARLTRERGRKPLAREHVIDKGTRGLSENYALRQAKLERSLAAAERRYRETTQAMQAFRSEK